jgi:hypothetical protein
MDYAKILAGKGMDAAQALRDAHVQRMGKILDVMCSEKSNSPRLERIMWVMQHRVDLLTEYLIKNYKKLERIDKVQNVINS